MKKAGFNMEKVKVNNSASILKLLNQNGPMSRKDIAAELGLTSAAVTILCNDLIEQKVIIDKGEVAEQGGSGRKKVLIDINYQKKLIVSLSIQPVYTFLYLCDIKGNPLEAGKLRTDNKIGAEEFLSRIAMQIQQMIAGVDLQWREVLGIGVTVTGIVDHEKGISKHAYGIWDYEVPIKEILEERLPFHVTLENNVKAFAEAELLYGARRSNDHLLFVKWGPGVGSSIATRNSTYDGKDFMAGELGHYIVDPGGEQCRCGRQGCLETKVSYQAIMKKIKKVLISDQSLSLEDLEQFELEVIVNNRLDLLLESQNPEIDRILRECIQILALTVVNSMTILAPNQVIMLSPIFGKESYYSYFMECCKNIDRDINENLIVKSKLEDSVNYIGGAAICANEDFFYQGGLKKDNERTDKTKENHELEMRY